MDNEDGFGELYTDVLGVNPIHTPSPTTPNLFSESDDDDDEEGDKVLFEPSSLNPKLNSDVDCLRGCDVRVIEEPAILIDDYEDAAVSRASRDAVAHSLFNINGIKVSAEKTEDFVDPDQESLNPAVSNSGLVKDSDSEEWDSDSEDDLQILLNETVHETHVERRRGVECDEDDDDGDEDLVIVTDEDHHIHHHHHQAMEQDWGNEAVQPSTDSEKKDIEAVKANVANSKTNGPRIGYSNHGFYQQHHLNFKYVRPGAAPTSGGSGTAAMGAPGQVRSPILGSMACRARGAWKPLGGRGFPNSSFHSGFGLPAWGSSASSRPFGSGLDFILPSHKCVFDIDIDSFEEKPWKHPGVDVSDFFNFGMDEEHWIEYCKQVEQLRLESTMQSKIRVYESGRTEKDHDPDLPPELATKATQHSMPPDSKSHVKTDKGDICGQESRSVRMQLSLPTGRAIQVEGGYGERLPSIDTRPPRIRDSDAVIEIVLQDSLEDSTISNGPPERQGNNFGGENVKGFHDVDKDDRPITSVRYRDFPRTSNGKQRESMARRVPLSLDRDSILPFHSELHLRNSSGPEIQSPMNIARSFGAQHVGRFPHGTSGRNFGTSEYSNETFPSGSVHLDMHEGHPKGKPADGIDTNQTCALSPSNDAKVTREFSMEPNDIERDDKLTLGDSLEGNVEEASDFRVSSETINNDDSIHFANRKKLSSCIEQLTVRDQSDVSDSKLSHSGDSQANFRSSRDHQKTFENDDEVMQYRPSKRKGDYHKCHGEEEHRLRDDYGSDDRWDMQRGATISREREPVFKSYAHKNLDFGSEQAFHSKCGEVCAREEDNSSGAWQRSENGSCCKNVKDKDVGGGHNVQVKPRERNKTKNNIKKSIDGDWRGHNKNDVLRHRESDDALMIRQENREDNKRKLKRDPKLLKREMGDDEELLRSCREREDSSRRKRERNDIMDYRKSEDDARTKCKPKEHYSSDHKQVSWYQKDMEEWRRLKLSHDDEYSLNKREEKRFTLRSGRLIDETVSTGSGRHKECLKVTGSDKTYHHNDRGRNNEQSKRDRTTEDYDAFNKVRGGSHAREKRYDTNERSIRHEMLKDTQSDHPSRDIGGQQTQKKKHHKNSRKIKDPELTSESRINGKRKLEDHSSGSLELSSKHLGTEGRKDRRNGREQTEATSVAGKEEFRAASDDEHPESRRGRSKMGRWSSHKERDDSSAMEADDSLAYRPRTRDETGDDRDRHLDTAAKLKMRSERFKLPMPGEKDKDPAGNKKADSEAAGTGAGDFKLQRPARKRKWTGT